MANYNLSETSRNKVDLLFNILAYSDKARHILELCRGIHVLKEPYVTLIYSESCYIQNTVKTKPMAYQEA